MAKSNTSTSVKANTPKTASKKARKVERAAAGTVECSSRQTSNGGNRHLIMGVSTSKLLKWMGRTGWQVNEAEKVLAHLQLTVSPSTVRCQLYSGRALSEGRAPTHNGAPAELSKEQAGELERIRKVVKTTAKA